MTLQLFDQISLEMELQVESFKGFVRIATIVTVVVMVVFVGVWVYIYWQLAESASYINAFLLLIPFSILT